MTAAPFFQASPVSQKTEPEDFLFGTGEDIGMRLHFPYIVFMSAVCTYLGKTKQT